MKNNDSKFEIQIAVCEKPGYNGRTLLTLETSYIYDESIETICTLFHQTLHAYLTFRKNATDLGVTTKEDEANGV